MEPKIRSTRVAVHFSSPVLRSRPSNTSWASDAAFHVVPMSSRFTKKSLVRASGRFVKTPCLGLSEVGNQDAHAAHKNCHLWGRQRQQLRPIDQQLLGRYREFGLEVVSEPISDRFEHGEGLHIGLLLRGVHASRREGNRHILAGILRRLLDAGASGKNDQVSEGDLLPARLAALLNALWIPSRVLRTFAS